VHLVGLVRENKFVKDGTKTLTWCEFVVGTKVTVSILFCYRTLQARIIKLVWTSVRCMVIQAAHCAICIIY